MERAINEKRWVFAALSGMCATFSFFESHPHTAYLVTLMAGLYLAGMAIGGRLGIKDTFKLGAGFLLALFLLGACQFLPSYEFLSLSNRGNLQIQNTLTDRLTPANLRHFIQPDFLGGPFSGWQLRWGYHEIVGYVGWVPLLLFLSGIPLLFRSRHYTWFFMMALVFISLALGDSTSLTKRVHQFFYYAVPGFSMQQGAGRSLGPVCLAIACGAGLALDAILRRFSPKRMPLWAGMLVVLAVLDLWAFGIRFILPCWTRLYDIVKYPEYSAQAVLGDPVLLEKVRKDPEHPRVAPPHEGSYNLLRGVASIFVSDVISLKEWAILIHYVADPNSPIRDLADVRYAIILPGTPIQPGRWKPIGAKGHYIYENQKAFPRVVLVGGYRPIQDTERALIAIRESKLDPRREVALQGELPDGLPRKPGPAGNGRIVEYTNNRVEMECQADRACYLFLADIFCPGWKVWVDGTPAPCFKANGVFRAVLLPGSGRHVVRMEYHSLPAYAGLVLSLFGWLVLAFILWKGRDWAL
jgi:hypothetical protein